MNDEREITSAEKHWTTRLLRCLNSIPLGIEICVMAGGYIAIRNLGAGDRYVDEHGHRDNVPELDMLLPKTGKQIDGRDSQI